VKKNREALALGFFSVFFVKKNREETFFASLSFESKRNNLFKVYIVLYIKGEINGTFF